jgi:hypothetical protein
MLTAFGWSQVELSGASLGKSATTAKRQKPEESKTCRKVTNAGRQVTTNRKRKSQASENRARGGRGMTGGKAVVAFIG